MQPEVSSMPFKAARVKTAVGEGSCQHGRWLSVQ